jgi:hypothetical protein
MKERYEEVEKREIKTYTSDIGMSISPTGFDLETHRALAPPYR